MCKEWQLSFSKCVSEALECSEENLQNLSQRSQSWKWQVLRISTIPEAIFKNFLQSNLGRIKQILRTSSVHTRANKTSWHLKKKKDFSIPPGSAAPEALFKKNLQTTPKHVKLMVRALGIHTGAKKQNKKSFDSFFKENSKGPQKQMPWRHFSEMFCKPPQNVRNRLGEPLGFFFWGKKPMF